MTMRISSDLSEKPKVSVYNKTNPKNDILDKSIVEVDGWVNTEVEKIFATFDHHRSWEEINLDTVPEKVNSLEWKEIATHMLDSDFVISSAVILAWWKEQIQPEMLRILESASRYCDLLEDKTETDENIKKKGLWLHLYLKNMWFKMTNDLTKERNELKEIPWGKFIPDASDSTISEIADKLVYDILWTIVSKDISKIDRLQDETYLAKKPEFLKKAKEACTRNEYDFTTIQTWEYIDPLFIYEFVKWDILIMTSKQDNWQKFIIWAKPSSNLYLTELTKRLNEIDPNVINQEVEEWKKPNTWGGRPTVFGSPFKINSGLTVEQVEKEVWDFLKNFNKKIINNKKNMSSNNFRNIFSEEYMDYNPTKEEINNVWNELKLNPQKKVVQNEVEDYKSKLTSISSYSNRFWKLDFTKSEDKYLEKNKNFFEKF